jgi:hypothetical protein
MLGIFEATGANIFTSMWSSLFGSATAFALMALLPEYIIVCIYIHILEVGSIGDRNVGFVCSVTS